MHCSFDSEEREQFLSSMPIKLIRKPVIRKKEFTYDTHFRKNIKQGRTLKPEDDACTTEIYFYLGANVNRDSFPNNKKIIGWKWNL